MTIVAKNNPKNDIENILLSISPVNLGINKKNELVRLIYEISERDSSSPEEIIKTATKNIDKGNFFRNVKKNLMELRYTSISPENKPNLKPLRINNSNEEPGEWNNVLKPERVLIEKSVLDYKWTKDFLSFFPGTEIIEVDSYMAGMRLFKGKTPVYRYNDRAKNIFLIKSKDAFIKVCPCSNGCESCGYWVLNIGFGCPMDCSYCFLQTYNNSPGLIFPANIEDYESQVMAFDGKLKTKIRIGTGEFTDSLAMDRYTGYSRTLISLFRKTKNMILELKTKSADIDNILKEKSHENIVIAWSMNASNMTDRYEKGASSLAEKISSAIKAAQAGFKVAFHFDPIIYSRTWENDYKAAVENIFKHRAIIDNTAWISLGTLRYTPGLKEIAEGRFNDNGLYYEGDLFVDTDGKLRYKRDLRSRIYNSMIEWIKSRGVDAWTYLCMEDKNMWRSTPLTEKIFNY